MQRTTIFLAAMAAACAQGSPDMVVVADAGRADAGMTVMDSGPPVMCARQSDCDDHFDCTDDACVFGGTCQHTAVNARCTGSQHCVLGQGCVSAAACTTNAQCDDSVACTRDLCVTGGMCQNVRDDSLCGAGMSCTATGCMTAGRCTTNADCADGVYCNGDEVCTGGHCGAGAARDCSDGDPCTGDVCNDAMRRCDHPPVSPCGGGTVASGTYALSPSPSYSCGAGTFGPVSQVMLTAGASSVSVTGFPAVLTGPAPSMGMFTATGTDNRGGCSWRYTLSGAFTMSNQFTGTWSLTFDFCDASLGCFSRFGEVNGTRM